MEGQLQAEAGVWVEFGRLEVDGYFPMDHCVVQSILLSFGVIEIDGDKTERYNLFWS